jgi:hypothetical protein
MSEVTQSTALDAVKAEHGKVVVIELDGKILAFKRLNRSKVTDMRTQINKKPDLAVEISINVCEFQCVLGKEHFKALSDAYPLAFCGNDDQPGVIDALIDLARGGGTALIRVE